MSKLFRFKARLQLERKAYECLRVNGDCLCRWCHRPYWKHRKIEPFACPTLIVDCEGNRLKL